MTSRVEELQRMCDNINENGGLDSGEWHMALLAQIAQNLAVIADVMMADRKTENSSEKPNNSTISILEQVDKPYIDIETGILHWCGWKYKRIYEDEPQMGDAKPIPLSNRVTHIETEPQTDGYIKGEDFLKIFTEPQTDCAWK